MSTYLAETITLFLLLVHSLLMNVDEAKGVCKDRSGWRSVVSAFPHGKKVWVYVCVYVAYWYILQKFGIIMLLKNLNNDTFSLLPLQYFAIGIHERAGQIALCRRPKAELVWLALRKQQISRGKTVAIYLHSTLFWRNC